MAKLMALTLAILMAAVAPAWGEEVRKTELIDIDGKSVDRLQLRYNFDASWVIDNQNILYRDAHRDHYLVTLKEACKQLDNRGRRFKFFPSWSWELKASHTYELKPRAGQECDVSTIARVDDAKATALRDAGAWRNW